MIKQQIVKRVQAENMRSRRSEDLLEDGVKAGHSLELGFSLIELMITVAIVAILAVIAIPSYNNSIINSNRAAGEACLSSYANYMERFYTTNLRYDQNTSGVVMTVPPSLDCASTANTGNKYVYSFSGTPTQSAYTLQAVPKGSQVKDTKCATLTLDQTGTRSISGTGTVDTCWRH